MSIENLTDEEVERLFQELKAGFSALEADIQIQLDRINALLELEKENG